MEATYREARLGGADENKVTKEFVVEMMETFKNQKAIHTRYAFEILLQMKAILKATPTLMDIPVPDGTHFTVCGDVHGQVCACVVLHLMHRRPRQRVGRFDIEMLL